MKRLLKKEVSLDTYTWQKKYGHLTSSVMMAQVDERLKRRFSVSASMEEISKIAETKTGASQANLGPEQAALAQSQHFDQLEALWNKRSPPRRRHNTVSPRATPNTIPLPPHAHHIEYSVCSVQRAGRRHRKINLLFVEASHLVSFLFFIFSIFHLRFVFGNFSAFFILTLASSLFAYTTCNMQHATTHRNNNCNRNFNLLRVKGLSRQTSLVEDRLESSDDDEYQDERAGMLSASYDHIHLLARLPGIRSLHDAWKTSSLRVPRTRTKFYVSTPPLHHSNNNSNNNSNSNMTAHTTDTTGTAQLPQRSHSSCHLEQAPDLVRDLLQPTAAERPVSLRNFFQWPHLWRTRRSQRNCQSCPAAPAAASRHLPRAMPIIRVENCDSRRVHRVRTDLVLHPQCTQATLAHMAPSMPEGIDPVKKSSSSSSSCGLLNRRSWPRFGSKREARAAKATPTETGTATCNECVTQ